MANQLYQDLQSRQPSQNPMSQLSEMFMRSPYQFLSQRQNVQIPTQYQNDPKQAVQYLMNSGAMTQEGFNNLVPVLNNMGIKLT